MRIVIALGGNALLRRSDPMTTEVQRKNIEHVLIVTHGLALRCFIMRFMHLSVEEFERIHNPLLAVADPAAFAEALAADMPPPPADQERIVASNRSGRIPTRA